MELIWGGISTDTCSLSRVLFFSYFSLSVLLSYEIREIIRQRLERNVVELVLLVLLVRKVDVAYLSCFSVDHEGDHFEDTTDDEVVSEDLRINFFPAKKVLLEGL